MIVCDKRVYSIYDDRQMTDRKMILLCIVIKNDLIICSINVQQTEVLIDKTTPCLVLP